MKLTIFGATGTVGKRVLNKALAQGHKVVAFGRNVEKLIDKDLAEDSLVVIKGYVFDGEDVYKAIKGSDAVISVLGGAFDGTDKTRSLGIKNIIRQMDKADVERIVVLGGMGILQADETRMMIDMPDYPEVYIPVGKEHLQAYHYLKESQLNWTIVGAPTLIDEDGTGSYITNAEYPPTPNKGKITTGDLADFLIAEVVHAQYPMMRVGISNL